eukprot:s5544_g4.t1
MLKAQGAQGTEVSGSQHPRTVLCLQLRSTDSRLDLVFLRNWTVWYGLQKKHADKMSFTNLSTFIGACQFQAA